MTAISLSQTSQAPRTRSHRGRRAEARVALLFLLPALLLVLVFRIFPLFWGFGISLTSATATDPGEFIGAGNYLRALDDPNFRASIANAAVVLVSVLAWPLVVAAASHGSFDHSQRPGPHRSTEKRPAVLIELQAL